MNYLYFQGIIICILGIIVDASSINRRDTLLQNSNNTAAVISHENVREKIVSSNESKIANEVLHTSNHSEIVGLPKNISSIIETKVEDAYRNKTAHSPKWLTNIQSGALQRTGLVTLGVMSAVVLFFLVRAIRVRHRRSKSRKYGVISSTASELEMEPLEGRGDDDEEETLYDSQQKYLIK